jgi:hypothetical protein
MSRLRPRCLNRDSVAGSCAAHLPKCAVLGLLRFGLPPPDGVHVFAREVDAGQARVSPGFFLANGFASC